MKSVRQDAWTTEEDEWLADIILRRIREGGTQLGAFQEAGAGLGRTGAACGFRWNAILRRQYAAQVELAMAERRARKEKGSLQPEEPAAEREEEAPRAGFPTWSDVLRFLRGQQAQDRERERRLHCLEEELRARTEAGEELRRENERLQGENQLLRRDYAKLVGIMERARRLQAAKHEHEHEHEG